MKTSIFKDLEFYFLAFIEMILTIIAFVVLSYLWKAKSLWFRMKLKNLRQNMFFNIIIRFITVFYI